MSNICEENCGSVTEIRGGKDSLETVDSFRYLSCIGGVELAVRDRIFCAWSKWTELARLLRNHSIPQEERRKV